MDRYFEKESTDQNIKQKTKPSESITIFNMIIGAIGFLGSIGLYFLNNMLIITVIGLLSTGLICWIIGLIALVVKTGERREDYLAEICKHLKKNDSPNDDSCWQDV